jgi:hypothetical protein
LVIGFIELLQLVTTSKDYAPTVLQTSHITIGHTRSSQSVRIFTSRCLIAGSNVGCSPSSGFRNYPRTQLPASHSNSSPRLNCSGFITATSKLSLLSRHGPHRRYRSSFIVCETLPSNGRYLAKETMPQCDRLFLRVFFGGGVKRRPWLIIRFR